jgi:hypothetical protein
MAQIAPTIKGIGLLIILLLLAALACNAPRAVEEVEPPVPTDTDIPPTQEPLVQPTPGIPETLPANLPTATPEGEEEGEALPTFTPIQQPTLAETKEPTATKRPPTRPASTAVPRATHTPDENAGPLDFNYHISWRFKDDTYNQSIATVTITAKGGGGEYVYYRDGLLVDGPVFEYEWVSCRGNPGTFRVESADGQFKEVAYFGEPLCATPTP